MIYCAAKEQNAQLEKIEDFIIKKKKRIFDNERKMGGKV